MEFYLQIEKEQDTCTMHEHLMIPFFSFTIYFIIEMILGCLEVLDNILHFAYTRCIIQTCLKILITLCERCRSTVDKISIKHLFPRYVLLNRPNTQ